MFFYLVWWFHFGIFPASLDNLPAFRDVMNHHPDCFQLVALFLPFFYLLELRYILFCVIAVSHLVAGDGKF